MEWVEGRSRLRWVVPFLALPLGVATVVLWISQTILLSEGVGAREAPFIATLPFVASMTIGFLWYGRIAPEPLEWLGLSEGGVQVQPMIRAYLFPWNRVYLAFDRLYLFSGRGRLSRTFQLSPKQVSALRDFVSRAS
jgi:hypothetical protein